MSLLARKLLVPQLMIAHRAWAESTTDAITVPASAQQGDLAVLFDRASNSSGTNLPTIVIPSGFTQLAEANASGVRRTLMSARILGANPGGTTITGMNGTSADRKILAVFSTGGARGFTFSPNPFNAAATDTDPVAQTVLASAGSLPLVVIAGNGSASNQANLTGSSTFDGTFADTAGTCIMGYKVYNSNPADFTVDATDTGQYIMTMSGYITVY